MVWQHGYAIAIPAIVMRQRWKQSKESHANVFTFLFQNTVSSVIINEKQSDYFHKNQIIEGYAYGTADFYQ